MVESEGASTIDEHFALDTCQKSEEAAFSLWVSEIESFQVRYMSMLLTRRFLCFTRGKGFVLVYLGSQNVSFHNLFIHKNKNYIYFVIM